MKEFKSICINDVMPFELPSFMKDNGIPDDADFDMDANSYDAYDGNFKLSWYETVPADEDYKTWFIFDKLQKFSRNKLPQILKDDGYKYNGYFKQLSFEKTLDKKTKKILLNFEYYHLIKDGNIDTLVKYLSEAYTK